MDNAIETSDLTRRFNGLVAARAVLYFARLIMKKKGDGY